MQSGITKTIKKGRRNLIAQTIGQNLFRVEPIIELKTNPESSQSFDSYQGGFFTNLFTFNPRKMKKNSK